METPSSTSPPSPLFDTIGRIALRHFPQTTALNTHRIRDYGIAAFTFFCVAISSLFEISASVERQQLLGAFAWMFLAALLLGENRETKAQVVIAVLFATVGEHF